jgi:uncharacterized protein YuzE
VIELRYDPEANAAYLRFGKGSVAESAELTPGVVLDYDKDGRIVGMEVLGAREKLAADMLRDAA